MPIIVVFELHADHFLPFGLATGDEMLPTLDDGFSDPQIKVSSCPIFGTQEDTIFVSSRKKKHSKK